MNLSSIKINVNLILWIIASLVFGIFIYRLLFFSSDSYLFFIINDLLSILLLIVLTLYIIKILGQRKPHPSALVLNVGIICAFIFLVILFAENILNIQFQNISANLVNQGIFENLVNTFYGLMFLGISSYWFASLKEFYFYKQYRKNNTYFITMTVFIAFSAISNLLFRDSEYEFIYNTFLT